MTNAAAMILGAVIGAAVMHGLLVLAEKAFGTVIAAVALGLALAGVMASAFLYRLGRNLVTGGVE